MELGIILQVLRQIPSEPLGRVPLDLSYGGFRNLSGEFG